MKKNNELKEASEKLDKISQDEHMRRIAEWREKAIIEENTNLSASFERGLKQGIEQGIEQKSLEIATELLKKDISIEFIQEITHLSANEIEKLKEKLK